MKAYSTVEVRLHSFLTSELDGRLVVRYNGQEALLDCLTLEDGTDRLPRNVGKKPPFYGV
jgi:hypothetical protein